MATLSEPLIQFRHIWEAIDKSGVTIRQQDVAQRSETISHLIGETGGVSSAYLSQILSPEKYKKQPSAGKVAVASLALRAEYQRHRTEIPDDLRNALDNDFRELLEAQRLQATTWTDPDQPLTAYSENLLVRSAAERTVVDLTAREQFSLVVKGGYRAGKTTFLARIADRCRMLGYRVYDIDTAEIARGSGENGGNAYSQFATLLRGVDADGASAAPTSMAELNAVIEQEVGRSSSPAVLILDDFNTLITALGGTSELIKALSRSWMQRGSRATGTSPWRRLSVAVTSTFSPTVVKAPDIASVYPTYTNIELPGLTDEEAHQLTELWVRHRRPTGLPDEQARAELVAEVNTWFGGHAYLMHDFIRTWVDHPDVPLSGPDTPLLPSQAGFLDDLAELIVRSMKKDGTGPAETEVWPWQAPEEDGSNEGEVVTLAGAPRVLANLGIVSSDYETSFTSPFLQRHLPERLRAAEDSK